MAQCSGSPYCPAAPERCTLPCPAQGGSVSRSRPHSQVVNLGVEPGGAKPPSVVPLPRLHWGFLGALHPGPDGCPGPSGFQLMSCPRFWPVQGSQEHSPLSQSSGAQTGLLRGGGREGGVAGPRPRSPVCRGSNLSSSGGQLGLSQQRWECTTTLAPVWLNELVVLVHTLLVWASTTDRSPALSDHGTVWG